MPYSDSTLQRMTKVELIEQLRCAEHNQKVAEEMLAQQAENIKDWVPVVRCRDCEYIYTDAYGYLICVKSGLYSDENDYCSRGQSADVRNTEGENKYE